MRINYPPLLPFQPTPHELERVFDARIAWVKWLGENGYPWPGELALSAFASAYIIALRAQ